LIRHGSLVIITSLSQKEKFCIEALEQLPRRREVLVCWAIQAKRRLSRKGTTMFSKMY
jgi:hypothetical protein